MRLPWSAALRHPASSRTRASRRQARVPGPAGGQSPEGRPQRSLEQWEEVPRWGWHQPCPPGGRELTPQDRLRRPGQRPSRGWEDDRVRWQVREAAPRGRPARSDRQSCTLAGRPDSESAKGPRRTPPRLPVSWTRGLAAAGPAPPPPRRPPMLISPVAVGDVQEGCQP